MNTERLGFQCKQKVKVAYVRGLTDWWDSLISKMALQGGPEKVSTDYELCFPLCFTIIIITPRACNFIERLDIKGLTVAYPQGSELWDCSGLVYWPRPEWRTENQVPSTWLKTRVIFALVYHAGVSPMMLRSKDSLDMLHFLRFKVHYFVKAAVTRGSRELVGNAHAHKAKRFSQQNTKNGGERES